MRVLICGGRDYRDWLAFSAAMEKWVSRNRRPSLVISGGARGADNLAEMWADASGIEKRVYPADWSQHGRAAGMIRNQQMLDDGNPDAVIAFPGGRGTEDMKRRARKAGVPVYVPEGAI